ncbi:MAG: phosphatidate cytidylyltransferase [Clostridia bacterium]|nr:phosphatidate cytidylyltransferase [Clostridia bacterium]
MKQRILTALVALPLVLLLLFSPVFGVVAAVMLASAMGFYEYCKAVKLWDNKLLCGVGFLPVLLIPLCSWMHIGTVQALLYLYALILFVILLIHHKTVTWNHLALLILGIIYIPYFLSHIIYIRDMELGGFYIWLVFIGAFITDTCAYFVGCGMGKTKLCPTISPKKTVAGAVGGIVGCGIAFLLFGMIANLCFAGVLGGAQFSFVKLFVCGLLCAVVSEIGDLVASVLKRQFAIKDFGSLLPGHGGILDRCDSIILVAPVLFVFLQQVGVLV